MNRTGGIVIWIVIVILAVVALGGGVGLHYFLSPAGPVRPVQSPSHTVPGVPAVGTNNSTSLAVDSCIYSPDGNLTCGQNWILLSQGATTSLSGNVPLAIPKLQNHLVSLINPNNPKDLYLLFLKPGEYSISTTTSAQALGQSMQNLTNPTSLSEPNSIADCQNQPVYNQDTCYVLLAQKNKDATICNLPASSASRDLCYASVALVTKDSVLCNKITNVANQQYCLSYFKTPAGQ